jgi:hypothetical protein
MSILSTMYRTEKLKKQPRPNPSHNNIRNNSNNNNNNNNNELILFINHSSNIYTTSFTFSQTYTLTPLLTDIFCGLLKDDISNQNIKFHAHNAD